MDYTSDGDGLRQTRTVGTNTTGFLWDTNGSLPLLLDDGTNSYLYGPSSAPIAQVNDSTGTIHYLSDDLIGSTRLITTSTGTVAGVTIYNEYGTPTSHTGTATSPIGYSDNWTDPDTGLIYLRARDYDPATAQFLTVDPLVDTTRQPYAYVADNPLATTDPSGCDWLSWTDPASAWLLNPHGGQYLTSEIAGFGNSASLGLTGWLNGIDGGSCEIEKDNFYEGVGDVADAATLVTGLGGAISAVKQILAAGKLFAFGGSATDLVSTILNLSTAGRTSEEAATIIEYAQRTNAWLSEAGPQVIKSTAGALRASANAAARAERLAAERLGFPYAGQAGHVPDTAITGLAIHPQVGSTCWAARIR